MFGMADLIVVAGLKLQLEFLAKYPHHIEFILGSFNIPDIQNLVGRDHVKQCIDFISNNKITVVPYYQADLKDRPLLAVVSSGREEIKYFANYGSEGCGNPCANLPPLVYAQFDVKSIGSNLDTLIVPAGLKLEEKIWPNVILTNGEQS